MEVVERMEEEEEEEVFRFCRFVVTAAPNTKAMVLLVCSSGDVYVSFDDIFQLISHTNKILIGPIYLTITYNSPANEVSKSQRAPKIIMEKQGRKSTH